MRIHATHATIDRLDRALGARLRARLAGRGPTGHALALAADAMSPLYRLLVLALILWRPTRGRGVRALVAAASAALIARGMRDRIGRPRPGRRGEGGLPSRHAAAAVAIAGIVAERRRAVGLPIALATAAGLVGRVSTGDHEPADVLAGAIVGGLVARAVARARRPCTAPRARRRAGDPGAPG